MYSAAFGVHGGIFVLTCASWSVIFGFQTPLQSGSFARSAQSFAVGGGLITGLGFAAGCATATAHVSARQAAKTAVRHLFIGPLSLGGNRTGFSCNDDTRMNTCMSLAEFAEFDIARS